MSDATIKAHKAASAERRKSTVNAAQLLKFRDNMVSGVKSATDTGMLIFRIIVAVYSQVFSKYSGFSYLILYICMYVEDTESVEEIRSLWAS